MYVSDLSTSGELSAITVPLPLYTEEIFSNQDDGLSRWSWNISNLFDAPILGTEVVNDCTCYLTIIVISDPPIYQIFSSFLGNSDSPGITLDSETERHPDTLILLDGLHLENRYHHQLQFPMNSHQPGDAHRTGSLLNNADTISITHYLSLKDISPRPSTYRV